MGLLELFNMIDINKGVKKYMDTPNAKLIDVRTPEEYKQGHIEESINVPLQNIKEVEQTVANKATPLFVYCRSGNRSGQAATILKSMGYDYVENIGGIVSYKGKIER